MFSASIQVIIIITIDIIIITIIVVVVVVVIIIIIITFWKLHDLCKSKQTIFLVSFICSSASGHKMLQKLSACCHIQSQ